MSWEALRLTSRSPGEVHRVLGPHGVDHLIRQAMDVCWREIREEDRTLAAARGAVEKVVERNLKVWAGIRKASPVAFFENLLPNAADGFVRQALVLCWMMMPRGKKSLRDVGAAVRGIFQRNLEAWEEDETLFTKGKVKRQKPARKTVKTKRKGGLKRRA